MPNKQTKIIKYQVVVIQVFRSIAIITVMARAANTMVGMSFYITRDTLIAKKKT